MGVKYGVREKIRWKLLGVNEALAQLAMANNMLWYIEEGGWS